MKLKLIEHLKTLDRILSPVEEFYEIEAPIKVYTHKHGDRSWIEFDQMIHSLNLKSISQVNKYWAMRYKWKKNIDKVVDQIKNEFEDISKEYSRIDKIWMFSK